MNIGDKNPTLKLTIENINSIEGNIIIGVFNNGEHFLQKGKAFKRYSLKVTKQTETIVIDNLPKGSYAISLYQDKNLDGICNLNLFGVPKEPYAFSNNIKPRLSAPSYNDCKFDLFKDSNIKIKLLK